MTKELFEHRLMGTQQVSIRINIKCPLEFKKDFWEFWSMYQNPSGPSFALYSLSAMIKEQQVTGKKPEEV